MKPTQSDPSSATVERLLGAPHPPWWIVAVIVVLVALAVFAATLNTPTFIRAQDSILHLSLLSHGKHIPTIFTQHFMGLTEGRYRPFAYALIALVRTFVSADNVVFWNLWLLVFHVLNALLVYAVARRLTNRALPALLALAVFLLHPLASAFGNQMNLFPYVLGGSFYLGSFLCYLHWVRGRRVSVYLAGLLLFACGLLSSHTVLTLPLLILLYELVYERTGAFKAIARLVPFGVLMLAAGYCFLTFHAHRVYYLYPPPPPAKALRFGTYCFAAGGADAVLGLVRGWPMRVPVSRLVGDPYRTWNLIAVALVLLVWLVTSVQQLLKKRWLAVGTFLILLSVLPRFWSPQNLTTDYAYWTFRYLPLAGFALLAGALLDRLLKAQKRPWRVAAVAAGAVLVLVYGVLLVAANVHVRTPESYWRYALKIDPKSEAASVNLGKVYLAKGNEKEALKHLFSPVVGSVRESCLAMARYYSRKGERVAAVGHLGIADRQRTLGLQYQEDTLSSVQVLYDAQALDFAEQYLGNNLMVTPHNTTALKLLGEIMAAKGYVPAAAACLEEVAEIDPGDTANAERLEKLHRRLYDPENHDRPAPVTPPDPDWLRYAVSQAHTKRIYAQIVQDARSHPDDPVLELVLALAMSEAGQHASALKAIDPVIQAMPLYAFAKVAKCYVAQSAGNTSLAVETIEQVEHVTPRDAQVWLYFASMRLEAKQHAIAVAATRAALRGNPNKPQTHGVLARLLVRQGRFRDALHHYRRALDQPRDKLGHVHNGLGYVLMRLGEIDRAIGHYRESIAIDPKHPLVYRNMAMAFSHKRRPQEVIQTLEKGLREIPGDVGLLTDLAWFLATVPPRSLRDGERAVRLAETALRKTKPVTPQILDVLAAAYAETGQFNKAVENARKAAQLAEAQGNRQAAQTYRQRLERYLKGQTLSP